MQTRNSDLERCDRERGRVSKMISNCLFYRPFLRFFRRVVKHLSMEARAAWCRASLQGLYADHRIRGRLQ